MTLGPARARSGAPAATDPLHAIRYKGIERAHHVLLPADDIEGRQMPQPARDGLDRPDLALQDGTRGDREFADGIGDSQQVIAGVPNGRLLIEVERTSSEWGTFKISAWAGERFNASMAAATSGRSLMTTKDKTTWRHRGLW